MKADKGAAASGSCPSSPWGFPSQSLQLTYRQKERKKKRKKKKSTYGVIDNYKKWKTHTHTHKNKPHKHTHEIQTVSRTPSPNTSLFSFFPFFPLILPGHLSI